LTSRKNFTEIVPGNPSVGGVKHERGSQIIPILDLSKATPRKWHKIGGKLVSITNRKWHMHFQLIPKSGTTTDTF